MQAVGKAEVDRKKVFAIFMLEEKGVPSIVLGETWRIVAAAIGRNDDLDHGYFVGFQNIISVEVGKIPESLTSEIESKIRQWVDEVNFQARLQGGDRLDLAKAKVHYQRYNDPKKKYTWGLVYLLRG